MINSKKALPYYPISEYYKERYGEKVYKLPIKLSITCPNRDGQKAYGGCIFCSESGGSFENLPSSLTVDRQLSVNREYIGKRYKANKFIAYFQNFSNTYMDLDSFKEIIKACDKEYVVAISISTRSDCISEDKLIFLREFSDKTGIDIVFELGLQTVNYKTSKILNRAEDLSDFIMAMNLLNKYDMRACVHMILALPWDDLEDVIESAKIINVLGVKEVKIHSLFIVKNTKLEKMYENNEFEMPDKNEFQNQVIEFLRRLKVDIAIQRIVGRAPATETVFCNWNTSWWLIRDEIIENMNDRGYSQGELSEAKELEVLKGEKK